MRASDFIVDIGPGAGVHGGKVIVAGTPEEVMACKESITGQYLSGRLKIDVPKKRRKGNGNYIWIKGAKENNLKNINVNFTVLRRILQCCYLPKTQSVFVTLAVTMNVVILLLANSLSNSNA